MNISADDIRAATRTAATVITTVPPLRPLRPDEAPARHRMARRIRPAWFAPLAAAAAVVIIVAGSVAAGARLSHSGHPATALGHAATAGPFASVPPYYVEFPNGSSAAVRATATGATLATITTSVPFVGVTGAADDRTFVLDAQRQVMGPTVRWPGHPAFYLLRLTAAGTEQSFTRLALPSPPSGSAVTGLALSPDGGKLAVEVNTEGAHFQPGLMEIRVYTLATGAFRSWSANGSTDPVDPDGFTGSGVDASETISWAADSRTLAFDWQDRSHTIGVRLLDTTAGGHDLIAASRLAVTEFGMAQRGPVIGGKDHVSPCVTDSIMSLDGSSVVCGYTTLMVLPHGKYDTTTGFIRYSTRTGKQTAVFGVFEFKGEAGGDISLYWTNSTGTVLIGGVLTPGGIRLGVLSGGTFTPLPGVGALGAAAW